MKKIQFIMLFFDIFLVIMATQVQAIQANVGFVGQKEVETGKEYTLNVKVSNDVAIGVIQGVLSYDNNIQNVTINASYNGWTTTYNTENGIFNSFNAVTAPGPSTASERAYIEACNGSPLKTA